MPCVFLLLACCTPALRSPRATCETPLFFLVPRWLAFRVPWCLTGLSARAAGHGIEPELPAVYPHFFDGISGQSVILSGPISGFWLICCDLALLPSGRYGCT